MIHYEENWATSYNIKFAENGQDIIFEYHYTDRMFEYYYNQDKSVKLERSDNWNADATKMVIVVRRKDESRTFEGDEDFHFRDGFENDDLTDITKYGTYEGKEVCKMLTVSETVVDVPSSSEEDSSE